MERQWGAEEWREVGRGGKQGGMQRRQGEYRVGVKMGEEEKEEWGKIWSREGESWRERFFPF